MTCASWQRKRRPKRNSRRPANGYRLVRPPLAPRLFLSGALEDLDALQEPGVPVLALDVACARQGQFDELFLAGRLSLQAGELLLQDFPADPLGPLGLELAPRCADAERAEVGGGHGPGAGVRIEIAPGLRKLQAPMLAAGPVAIGGLGRSTELDGGRGRLRALRILVPGSQTVILSAKGSGPRCWDGGKGYPTFRPH